MTTIDYMQCAMDTTVQAMVLGSPAVQAGIKDICTEQAMPVLDEYASLYGSTSIMVGFTLPLIALGVSVALYRIFTKPSVRGGILLFAMMLTVVDSGTLVAGKIYTPSWIASHSDTYISMLMIGPALRNGFVLIAASMRFSVVYTSVTRQRILIGFLSFIAFLSMALPLGLGFKDLRGQGWVGKAYWYAIMIGPIAYIVAGIATFTAKLRSTQRRVAGGGGGNSRIGSLETANNLIMGFGIAACLVTISVGLALDTTSLVVNDNMYVAPTAFLAGACWTVCENCFEGITMIQNAFSQRSRHVPSHVNSSSKQVAGTGALNSLNAASNRKLPLPSP
ncbi:uncharacterized protein EV422DRAFT_579309 [Fimicolochytrium jonesii]|uniref:uncharacterized protein n=1 Tax=Fimicolochytrium jonesii TaxID=1396493 RepID=UPI0022FE7322|nr:uncharacterized protein EV422DRAFT_579309 [Fimicolochytrium jonesii]KAI8819686.1 hypothetical protein EV422DRAFT_579309 [Fimicolochytrium jonesii]